MALLRVVKTAHGGETPSGEGSSVDENTPGTSQERHFKITPSHGDDDGAGFVLPDFDFLKAAAAGGKPLGSYVTTRIVDVLFQEMATHTVYPSRAFYQNVGRALVSQYPQLADTCGSGHDSWVMFIRQNFKNERRKLSTDRVMSSREKYGSTAKKPRTSSGTTTEELQRGSIGQTLAQSSTPCGEDASSLAQHEAWLCQEWKKPNPDNQQMRCRLELTHQARVEQLSRLSVAVAVTKYPYLRDADLFFHDFNMLLKKDGAAAVVEGMQIVLSLALGDRLGAKRKDTMPVLEADKAAACARRKKHIRAVRTLQLLAKLVHQPRAMEAMFVPLEGEKPSTPCIAYSGTSVEQADDLFLYIEKQQLLRVIDAEQGIAAMMAAYYLFDINYATAAHSLCCVVEHLFFGVRVTKPRCATQRFISSYVAEFSSVQLQSSAK
ncbi:unnamed protein product [Ixodes pacificus]